MGRIATTKQKREQARQSAIELEQLHARIYSLIGDGDHEAIESATKALFRASYDPAEDAADPVIQKARELSQMLLPWIRECAGSMTKTEKKVLDASYILLRFIGNYGFSKRSKPAA